MSAVLVLGNGSEWNFDYMDDPYNILVHKTRYGNIYRVLFDDRFKGIWVARLVGGNKWVNVEKEIDAVSIRFGSGGEYIFPK